MSNLGNTGFGSCGCGGFGCGACQPANVVFQRACVDPGLTNYGVALAVYDSQFCPRRLANPSQAGFLISTLTAQGYVVAFSNEPAVALSSLPVTSGSAIGNLVVEGNDNILRQLSLPNVAGLYLSTNASGQLVVGPLPASTVPDPLSVTTLNATTATIGTLNLTGQMSALGLSTGTVVSLLGIDAGGNLVKGTTSSTGVSSATFYESATDPSPNTPNDSVVAGGTLTIGNEIESSGTQGSLLSVDNTQTLRVVSAGYYEYLFSGQVLGLGNTGIAPAINLLVNGIVVNDSNCRGGVTGGPIRGAQPVVGFGGRRFNVNDTLQLQLASGSGANVSTFQVRLRMTRLGN